MKNVMQLKAIIKNTAKEKNTFQHSLSCKILCLKDCWKEYQFQTINPILF